MNLKFKKISFLVVMIATLSAAAGCSNKNQSTDMEKEMMQSMEELEAISTTEAVDEDDIIPTTDAIDVTNVEDESSSEVTTSDETTSSIEQIAPVKQKEVNIYSMDSESLDVVAAVALIEQDTVLTPEIIVDMVVDSFADQLVIIGIDSVTTEKDTVIVSFKADQAPLYNSGSTLESTILDAIAQSLVDNLKEYPKVIFRVEGKAYASGHYEFKLDEVYLDNTGK